MANQSALQDKLLPPTLTVSFCAVCLWVHVLLLLWSVLSTVEKTLKTNKNNHKWANKKKLQRGKTPRTKWPLDLLFHLVSWSTSGLSSAYEHKMWYHLHEVLHHPWEPAHYGISTWCLANTSLCARRSLIQVTAGHQKSLEKDIWPWKSKGCPLGILTLVFTAY